MSYLDLPARLSVLLCAFYISPLATAAPLGTRGIQSLDVRDAGPASIKIWVPILAVIVGVCIIAVLFWFRKSIGPAFTRFGGRAAQASAMTLPAHSSGPRELTAEQLAGGAAPGTTTDNNATTGTAGRNRRARRTRRTPSQISTTSLPAYNKEPGDEELVIFRGREDMDDDAPLEATIIMPPVEEQDAEDSLHSRGNSQASVYSQMPDTPNDTPLLQNDESNDNSTNLVPQPIHIPGDNEPARQSFDTMNSSQETSSLMRDSPSRAPADARGEAPPYFEVLPDENTQQPPSEREENTSSAEVPASPPASASGSPPAQDSTRRRSTFRSLFHARGPAPRAPEASTSTTATPNTTTSSTLGHNRGDSDNSLMSSEVSHAPRSHRTHRPSQSGSGSLLNLSPFRTISRQKSTNTLNSHHLNSPSLISLNSISAPLSHTLVRTEFTYPKAGPTPDQVKLISSRDSFARFGMPYGADAIAYAASASRQELDPPPDFDTPGSETHLPLPRSAGMSHSRLRSVSSLAPAPDLADSTDSVTTEADTARQTPSPESARPTPSPESARDTPSPEAPRHTPSSELPIAASSSSSSAVPEPAAEESQASRSETAPVTSRPLNPPPTSFKVTPASIRSVSRASSMQSYATAHESAVASTPTESDNDEYASAAEAEDEVEEPVTPTMTVQHLAEGTDVTLTPTTVRTSHTIV